MASILGGTQSLHVNSRDEALALPSEESVQLSLRTQQILAEESGVSEVVDPLGGSYYIESLTNRLEAEANQYLEKIDRMGGAISALEQGYQIMEIHESAYKHQKEVEDGDRVVVGVNKYTSETPPITGLVKVDPEQTRMQIDGLRRLRRERDDGPVKRSLSRLEEVARSDENTVPAILECVESYCTLGEISDVFRGVFGEQREFATF